MTNTKELILEKLSVLSLEELEHLIISAKVGANEIDIPDKLESVLDDIYKDIK